ncbi:TPA: hypothetical protein EYP38_05020 [Candidatus Micrarchaeota archaeon]|nr:hypothetical protein [Candidatus Micrarchaeota archaeon]
MVSVAGLIQPIEIPYHIMSVVLELFSSGGTELSLFFASVRIAVLCLDALSARHAAKNYGFTGALAAGLMAILLPVVMLEMAWLVMMAIFLATPPPVHSGSWVSSRRTMSGRIRPCI